MTSEEFVNKSARSNDEKNVFEIYQIPGSIIKSGGYVYLQSCKGERLPGMRTPRNVPRGVG